MRFCLVLWLCFCTCWREGDAQQAVCSPAERRTKEVNDTVEFQCNCEIPQNLPPNTLEVRWYRNGPELVRTVTNGDRNLTFTVGERDGGVYRCQCEPCNAQCSLCYGLAVEPHITYFGITPSIVRAGERINITCTAVGYPLPHDFFVFRTGGVPGSFDDLHLVGNMFTGTTTAMLSHNGTYACRAQNSIPPQNRPRFDIQTASILVYEPPGIVGTSNYTVRGDILETGEAYLECRVQSTPTAGTVTVTWLRNGETLDGGGGKYHWFTFLQSPFRYGLKVSNLTEEDLGEYICRVGSQYNETENEATVFVVPQEEVGPSETPTLTDLPGNDASDSPTGSSGGSSFGEEITYIVLGAVIVVFLIVALVAGIFGWKKLKEWKERQQQGGGGSRTVQATQHQIRYVAASETVSINGSDPSGEASPSRVNGISSDTLSVNESAHFNFTDSDTDSHYSGALPSAADELQSVAIKGVSAKDIPNLRHRMLSSTSPTET